MTDISAAAIGRLAWDVSVPLDSIKVKVEKGWITLTGEVDWHYQKDSAEQDVRRLLGVIDVSNQITIKRRVDVSNISDDIMHDHARASSFVVLRPEDYHGQRAGGECRALRNGSLAARQAGCRGNGMGRTGGHRCAE
ncbi:hypothetical protein sphantq_00549 [Sphingobium sp. AntQ-1]|nr:hypothetical protein sphantq_00549 [Sphingobium sp. AntQ-1]